MSSESSQKSLRLSIGGGLPALKKDIIKLMECPVCTEIPLPPIYTCVIGHTICSECRWKLTQCVLCKSRYTGSRNFSLESIVLAAKFYCENRNRGCTFKDTVDKLTEHHTVCPERRMKCYLSGFDGCLNALLYMTDYESHLRNVHKDRDTSGAKNANVFESFIVESEDVLTVENKMWTSSLHKFSGKVFTNHVFKRGRMFYVGFHLVGDVNDGSRFAVKTTIYKPSDSQIPKYELTTMISSIRELSEQPKTLPDVALNVDLMKKLCQIKKSGKGAKTELRWNIKYEIITLTPLPTLKMDECK